MKKQLISKNVFVSIENYTAGWNLKKLVKYMIVLALIISLVGSYLWYTRMFMTSERRFWSALNNSMATQSVTRTLTSGGSGNTVTQDQQFFFAPQKVSRSHVSFIQKSATVDTAVETEGISFVDHQFSRYNSFRTNQLREDGTTPNLDSILGKWEGNKVADEDLEDARLNYVSELVTLAVFGNYGSEFRNDVISQLKQNNVYQLNIEGGSEDTIDGKKVLIFPVSVGLKGFTEVLQKAFTKAGYGEFPPLDPSNYTDDSRVNATFAIDPKNNSIAGIKFGSRAEQYSGYGIFINVAKPNTDFESGQLEAIVQEEIQTAL